MHKDQDLFFMKKAIELAKKGEYLVLPNPKVGCVIVKDGNIIGKGYHKRYGEKHAEVLAIEDARKKGHSFNGAIMYVSLEPCSHHGKQPPCTDKIIKSGIKRVVIATYDPNPLVNKNGVNILKKNGVDVAIGIMQNEAIELNKEFFKFHIKKIPYVAIKVAQSIDAKITDPKNQKFLFNHEEENIYVHMLRQKYHALMVSINTVLKDDPMLNVRFGKIYRQPIRIVLDSQLKIPLDCNIVKTASEYQTIVFHTEKNQKKQELLFKKGIELIKVNKKDSHINLFQVFKRLYEKNILSVLVEGGGKLNYAFLKEKLVDHWYSFVFDIFIGGSETLTSVEGEGFFDLHPKLINTKTTSFSNSILIEGDVGYVLRHCSADRNYNGFEKKSGHHKA